VKGRIVGFDVRCSLGNWDKPVSVSRYVWPSGVGAGWADEAGLSRNWHLDLPSDLVEVQALLEAEPPASAVTIAGIEALWDSHAAFRRLLRRFGEMKDCSPAVVEPGWRLLGYDIANAGLLSGLSDFQYSDAERAELLARRRGPLNGFGLLPDPAAGLRVCFSSIGSSQTTVRSLCSVCGRALI
jgi:hypothetical protein